MGLFSKKTIVCEECGKEYQARITFGVKVCDACMAKRNALERSVKGYVNYRNKMYMNSFTAEELTKIGEHRNAILEKYKLTNGISSIELISAGEKYKSLSDATCADILTRISRSTVEETIGAAYTKDFFVLTGFEKVVVDVKDVFAVGYTSDYRLDVGNNEAILCAVFTNDPYVPVFPMIYVGKKGFFEITKSKKGRQGVADLFETLCPNLKYPVDDLKQLKKTIKQDGAVKGNVTADVMLDQIGYAMACNGIFNTKEMTSELDYETANEIEKYGYIRNADVVAGLRLDKMFNKMFWEKQMKKLSE